MEGGFLRRSSVTVIPFAALAVAFVWGWIVFALAFAYLLVAALA
ncbi:MAG: hypothetical protein QOI32_667, partial [Thermoleophilaceae bacterium]|nr:hypothetical protein [Thermoleophilaceae bacterium]